MILNLIATNKRVGSRASQCSLFESSDSNGWAVRLGVIVPIPPHTQNISSNLNNWRNNEKCVFSFISNCFF